MSTSVRTGTDCRVLNRGFVEWPMGWVGRRRRLLLSIVCSSVHSVAVWSRKMDFIFDTFSRCVHSCRAQSGPMVVSLNGDLLTRPRPDDPLATNHTSRGGLCFINAMRR